MMAGSVALACASQGAAVAWVVPVFKNARPVWRFIEQFATGVAEMHKSERTARFLGGGWLGVYTADNDVSIRGEAFDLVIVDEAARIAETTYTDAILPTLADRAGRIVLISTPKARNWFYNEWVKAKADGTYAAAWQAPTSANPNLNIQRAAALAKKRMPDRTYRQEWLAEFIEGQGAVFRNVRAVCTLAAPDKPERHEGHAFVMGVDWGKANDYTRLRVFCRECMRVVDWDGFNHIEYAFQRDRLRSLAQRWGVAYILAESNSIGEPNIEMLRRDNLSVRGFQTTAGTKPPLIEALSLAIECRQISLPAEDADELEAYERKTNANTGLPTYSAPDGMHDDRVMADALAYRAAVTGAMSGGALVGFAPTRNAAYEEE